MFVVVVVGGDGGAFDSRDILEENFTELCQTLVITFSKQEPTTLSY